MVSSNLAPSAPTSSLSTWQGDTEGIVAGITGSSLLTARLREMGVVPGVRLRILRHSCPMILQVENDRLCMRRQDAEAIRLEDITSEDTSPTSKLAHLAQV